MPKKLLLRLLACLNLFFSVYGLWLLAQTVRGVVRHPIRQIEGAPYVGDMFWIYSSINLIFLVALLTSVLGLWVQKRNAVVLAIITLASETAYVLIDAIVPTFFPSSIRHSLAGAAGIGNVAITPQLLTLYPVIGLIVIVLVYRANYRVKAAA